MIVKPVMNADHTVKPGQTVLKMVLVVLQAGNYATINTGLDATCDAFPGEEGDWSIFWRVGGLEFLENTL